MRKSDMELLAEQYNTRILSEAPFGPSEPKMMPFEAGASAGSPQKGEYQTGNPAEWNAVGKYPKMTKNLAENPAFEQIISSITDKVGEYMLQAIAGEDGRIEDSKQEAATRAAEFLKTIKIGESPLFTPSHTVHVARNVIDALIRSGTIKEVDRKRGPSTRAERPTASGISPEDISFS